MSARSIEIFPSLIYAPRGNHEEFEMDDNPGERNNSELKDMSFKVPVEFHYEFKLEAHTAGITMRTLLERSFDAYKKLKMLRR